MRAALPPPPAARRHHAQTKLSARQNNTHLTNAYLESIGFQPYFDCATLFREVAAVVPWDVLWQVHEWYDEGCKPAENVRYLVSHPL